ncbi:hypothetical protein M011DRAFT_312020 [Sporormia fimetaria CBS 119925]|uniref:Uncharacterized protein n=1 Tax=Sporormia fimetaria CBS 119925 TaxID=1340428 RepID=A0A6A6VK39_9PLEO|nr:hypothetical protein M011DRAFT_312020 [Sporormia fimetaria CBS 119925]
MISSFAIPTRGVVLPSRPDSKGIQADVRGQHKEDEGPDDDDHGEPEDTSGSVDGTLTELITYYLPSAASPLATVAEEMTVNNNRHDPPGPPFLHQFSEILKKPDDWVPSQTAGSSLPTPTPIITKTGGLGFLEPTVSTQTLSADSADWLRPASVSAQAETENAAAGTKNKHNTPTFAAIGAVVGIVVISMLAFLCILKKRRKGMSKMARLPGETFQEMKDTETPPMVDFSPADLLPVTMFPRQELLSPKPRDIPEPVILGSRRGYNIGLDTASMASTLSRTQSHTATDDPFADQYSIPSMAPPSYRAGGSFATTAAPSYRSEVPSYRTNGDSRTLSMASSNISAVSSRNRQGVDSVTHLDDDDISIYEEQPRGWGWAPV